MYLKSSYIIILVIVNFKSADLAGRSKQSLLNTPRFKTFSCMFSDEMRDMMYPNVTCKINKIDRRTSALNVYIAFKVPTEHLFVSLVEICLVFNKLKGI